MVWTPPLTNRTGAPGEYYEWVDYQRARSNIIHVATEELPVLGFPVSLETMPQVTIFTEQFLDTINILERNLNVLGASGLPLPGDWEPNYPHWTSSMFDRTVNFTDMNRWERNPLILHMLFERLTKSFFTLIAGTCYAGDNKTTQRFSRGR